MVALSIGRVSGWEPWSRRDEPGAGSGPVRGVGELGGPASGPPAGDWQPGTDGAAARAGAGRADPGARLASAAPGGRRRCDVGRARCRLCWRVRCGGVAGDCQPAGRCLRSGGDPARASVAAGPAAEASGRSATERDEVACAAWRAGMRGVDRRCWCSPCVRHAHVDDSRPGHSGLGAAPDSGGGHPDEGDSGAAIPLIPWKSSWNWPRSGTSGEVAGRRTNGSVVWTRRAALTARSWTASVPFSSGVSRHGPTAEDPANRSESHHVRGRHPAAADQVSPCGRPGADDPSTSRHLAPSAASAGRRAFPVRGAGCSVPAPEDDVVRRDGDTLDLRPPTRFGTSCSTRTTRFGWRGPGPR